MANLNITPSINPILINQSVTFSTTPGYYSYSWSGSPVNVTGTTNQSNSVTFTSAGSYDVSVEVCGDESGCCQTFTINFNIGLTNSGCDYDENGIVSGETVTYQIPADLETDVYIWFKVGGWADKMTVIRDSDNQPLLRTRFVGKTQQNANTQGMWSASLQDPEVSNTYWYYNLDLLNIGVGCSIDTLSGNLYTQCFGDWYDTGTEVSPYIFSGVEAVRSNNWGTNNVEVGVYIKIPETVHNGSSMTVTCAPFQNYTCATFKPISNSANFRISCSPITEAGSFDGCV